MNKFIRRIYEAEDWILLGMIGIPLLVLFGLAEAVIGFLWTIGVL